MSFFSDIGKKTTQATSKIAKETKLKMSINENKENIKELYEKIGKKVYESHVREEQIDLKEFVKDDCLKIDELSKKIDKARKEILILNHKKMCKKCFAEIEDDAKFCSKCGEKQTEEKTVFEKAEEKLNESDIAPENEKEAEIVKKELEEKNEE